MLLAFSEVYIADAPFAGKLFDVGIDLRLLLLPNDSNFISLPY